MSRKKYAERLSGEGAAIKGARWNSVGVPLIYAGNRPLAMAEVAVHFTLATLPADYVMVSIFIPDNVSFKKINRKELPSDWNTFPHTVSTQLIGDLFVRDNKYCLPHPKNDATTINELKKERQKANPSAKTKELHPPHTCPE